MSLELNLMIGQTIGRYRVLAKLGEGGMGVVYKAEDTQLDRVVALKFLAPHLVSNEDVRKRFIREAKTAAALSHPNICTVYEIGEASGRTFISMAYLDGRELSEIVVDGPMEANRVVELAIHFADALAEAHSKGAVHRDIKPANLFVTSSGRGVVLDFGLAQLTSDESRLTHEGAVLGTCGYASPEQSTGGTVDARTDVWALGCVIYEMLAGEPAFRGHYAQAIIYSIVNEDPEPLDDAPTALMDVVKKCLAKKPEERYRDGSELLAKLHKLRGVSGRAKVRSTPDETPLLAVLPFQNRGGNPNDEYFADGVTEDVITTLSKLGGFRVVPRSSAYHFKGKNPGLSEVVDALGVTHVLEGAVRIAGERLRITVELVDARKGEQLWAERYDRVLEDVFDVQEDIAETIGKTLALKLSSGGFRIRRHAPHPEALRLYYQGQAKVNLLSESGIRSAISFFEQAAEIDPNYIQPRLGMARAAITLGMLGIERPTDVASRARAAGLSILEIDESSHEAHFVLGLVRQFYDWNFGAAEESFVRSIELDPRNSDVRSWYAIFLAYTGRGAEGVEHAKLAAEADPLNPMARQGAAVCLIYAGRFDEALEECRQTLNIHPHFVTAISNMVSIYAVTGRWDLAGEAVESWLRIAPNDPTTLGQTGSVLAKAGREKEARENLAKLEAIRASRYCSPSPILWIHVALGQLDEALVWMERAVEERDGLIATFRHHPSTKPLLEMDARFDRILRKGGL